MMRALYSSVSGLKSHQTKMDVIGNNIANVNTVGFKSSRVTFSTMMYQKTSSASGANAEMGTGGINAKQIGLGANFASTAVSIATGGAAESTGNAFDLKISDNSSTSFFIVNNGTENLFTRAGAFYVDGAGNLCMESTGYTVMGWQADKNGNIRKDTVSPLKVMSAANQTSQPEYTTKARCTGILDDNSKNVSMDTGYSMNLIIYDNLGYPYTAKFAAQKGSKDGSYTVNLTDILDANGKSIIDAESSLGLGDLFGTGTSTNAQGSNVDITDNYTINTGMANMLKKLSAQKDDAGNRTYTFTAETINQYLGPFDALKEGFTVKYVVAPDPTATEDPDDPNCTLDHSSAVTKIYDENGQDVSDQEPYKTLLDKTKIQKEVTSTDIVQGWVDTGKLTFTNNNGKNTAVLTDTQLAELNDLLMRDGTTQTSVTGPVTVEQTITDGKATYKFTNTGNTAGGLESATTTYTLKDYMDKSYLSVNATEINNKDIFTTDLPKDVELRYNVGDGSYTIVTPSTDGFQMQFSTKDGSLTYIGAEGSSKQVLQMSKFTNGNFSDIEIDFNSLKNLANSGSSTAALSSGDGDGAGKGKKIGTMTGLTVDTSGKIFGTYDNGNTVLIGQIAVARFANASGLESTGDNCFKTTLNSGEFDGIGVEIDADGSSISTGELEMSNVDLATEFTQMITTQRGYQANSRVITTSDSILEELINLKR